MCGLHGQRWFGCFFCVKILRVDRGILNLCDEGKILRPMFYS